VVRRVLDGALRSLALGDAVGTIGNGPGHPQRAAPTPDDSQEFRIRTEPFQHGVNFAGDLGAEIAGRPLPCGRRWHPLYEDFTEVMRQTIRTGFRRGDGEGNDNAAMTEACVDIGHAIGAVTPDIRRPLMERWRRTTPLRRRRPKRSSIKAR
jgi:hypothetical protein